MIKNIYTLALLVLISACSNPGNKPQTVSELNPEGAEFYGEAFDHSSGIPVEEAAAKITSEEPVELKITGEIVSVCQQKGCWLKLDAGDGTEMRVKFKDYAFFVPIDAAGSTAVLNGNGYLELTSVKTLRHYAEDAGKSQEEIAAITEPKSELVFMASGVAILSKKQL